MNQPLPRARSLLCIGAHADDIEIGCCGTLMRLIEEQPDLQISWSVFSGDEKRRQEAINSAEKVLNSLEQKSIDVFDFRDGYFPAHFERIKDTLVSLRDRCSPDFVLTHRAADAHQDHRLLGELCWQVFRNSQIWEYEIPKYDADLGKPNVYVSLSEHIAESKMRLLATQFASQHDKPWYNEDTFRALLSLRGLESRSPSRSAEAFYVRKVVF